MSTLRKETEPQETPVPVSPTPAGRPSPHFNQRGTKRVAVVGVGMLVIWMAVLGALSLAKPKPFAGMWLILGQQLLGGRALGIATGISLEIPKPFLIVHCTITDMVLVMMLYPLLILGVRHATRLKFIGSMVGKARAAAEHYYAKLHKVGPVGLAFFVFLPIWSTGPMTGSVLGNMLGFRNLVTFLAVAVGDMGAIAMWTVFFDYMDGFAGEYGKWIPVGLLALIIVGFLITRARKRMRGRSEKREKREAAREGVG